MQRPSTMTQRLPNPNTSISTGVLFHQVLNLWRREHP